MIDPQRHNPELHTKILGYLKHLPPGQVLDLPAGPGYLLRDLKKLGFDGWAAEIDESLHVFPDLNYKKVDMTQSFPFPDGSFDYVTSIEGIEHIENHFSFLREVRRVLKPGGKLFLTTPNVHSLESRLNFFLSGFHNLSPKPIPLDVENIYFEHINPITLDQLYFACHRSGLKLTHLDTYRLRKGSALLYPFVYVFHWLALRRAVFYKEKDLRRRQQNQELYQLLRSPKNQLGSHTIIIAEAK